MSATVTAIWDWAWARHQNELSWYVRPLFLLPLAWASYRRSVTGIVVTLVALATSMAWFPVPAAVDPQVASFLAFEQEYLTGSWPAGKILVTLLVPVMLAAFCAAFWWRSVAAGAVVLALIAVVKVTWGVVDGGGTGAAAWWSRRRHRTAAGRMAG
ncbi:hypothetical protein ACQPX6_20185 [Actinomycetospora sp. CA-101289]|uniref:hypothetical protein n=1 Tax=Actinomycetospora sp. CA-101289 TaxID=3239893 RepID=UPI003D958545